MQWREFVFSEKKNLKILRHLSFWAAWWLYFLLCYYLLQHPFPANLKPSFYQVIGDHLPLKIFLLVLLYTIASYPVIYLFLPPIIRGKWFKILPGILILFGFSFIASHLLYWNIFPWIDPSFESFRANNTLAHYWPAVSLGLINFIKVAAAAISIKYVKYWWLKQKESERLDREKASAELQLLKAQVHPDFLLKTLNNIYIHALSFSPRTPEMLLKLSDLLSYMLYECDRSLVPLEKEITMMKEYMQLEKIRHNDESEMEVNIKGDLTGRSIAPFLLLPFIENSFKHSSRMTEQFWINMDIRMEGDHFSMKLTNGISEKLHGHSLASNGLANVQKRLTLLYPDKHDLKIASEQEMLIVLLTIKLDGVKISAMEENDPNSAMFTSERQIQPVLNYASE